MRDALEALDYKQLMEFFKNIGVDTHISRWLSNLSNHSQLYNYY